MRPPPAAAAAAAPPPPPRLHSPATLQRAPTFLPQLRRSSSFRPLRLTLAAASGYQPSVAGFHSKQPVEVEMVRGRDGVWSSPASEKTEQKVMVLWDLDNKPPRGPPYEAAVALRQLAALFGRVMGVSAYANRHAFLHLPQWVLEQRRERRRVDDLERRGFSMPADPYTCGVCGRRCRTHADLRKHFRQLHEREREKKISRLRSLKGKKRRRYKERYISGNTKYEEAARDLRKPKVGYGLAAELRRAGVFVSTVEDKPQAADGALKRQVHHSMTRGIDWLFLVSDDSDFTEILRRARESDLRTVVIGDVKTTLSREADIWFPWNGVETGEVGEEVLRQGRPLYEEELGILSSQLSDSDRESDWSELDSVVDEIVVENLGFRPPRESCFSEEELTGLEDGMEEDGTGNLRTFVSALPGEELFWDSEDEEEGYI